MLHAACIDSACFSPGGVLQTVLSSAADRENAIDMDGPLHYTRICIFCQFLIRSVRRVFKMAGDFPQSFGSLGPVAY